MRPALGVFCKLLVLLNLGALPALAQAQRMSFSVRHEHRLGHCEGLLRIDTNGLAYETPHRAHVRVWPFSDIRQLDILSTKRLVVHTYGKPESFNFQLGEGELTADAYRLLAEHIERGVTSRVLFPATQFRFELPVKHRHRFGGCEGILRIGTGQVIYETQNADDRRLWRMRDIRGFGTTGPYDLRLSTEQESFTFDLKQPLNQEVYDHLWQAIYAPQFAPVRNPR